MPRRQGADPAGGEGDGERQALQALHEAVHDLALLGGDGEVGPLAPGEQLEQRDGGVVLQHPHPDAGLLGQPERLARRGDDAERGGARQQRLGGLRGAGEDLLAVVEHEERGAQGVERVAEALEGALGAGGERQAHGAGHGAHHVVEGEGVAEVAEPGAAGQGVRAAPGQVARQARLADAGRAEHRGQAGLAPQPRQDRRHLGLAADERLVLVGRERAQLRHEGVALAVLGDQVVGVRGVGLDLLAQAAHRGVGGAGDDARAVAPDALVQLVAGDGAALVAPQVGDELELAAGQALGAAVGAADLAGAQVDGAGLEGQRLHSPMVPPLQPPGLGPATSRRPNPR
ncbi:MAG: hypothetical protein R3F59_12485 [Myxococcota bacterium]